MVIGLWRNARGCVSRIFGAEQGNTEQLTRGFRITLECIGESGCSLVVFLEQKKRTEAFSELRMATHVGYDVFEECSNPISTVCGRAVRPHNSTQISKTGDLSQSRSLVPK
jgi:hypothetical protein